MKKKKVIKIIFIILFIVALFSCIMRYSFVSANAEGSTYTVLFCQKDGETLYDNDGSITAESGSPVSYSYSLYDKDNGWISNFKNLPDYCNVYYKNYNKESKAGTVYIEFNMPSKNISIYPIYDSTATTKKTDLKIDSTDDSELNTWVCSNLGYDSKISSYDSSATCDNVGSPNVYTSYKHGDTKKTLTLSDGSTASYYPGQLILINTDALGSDYKLAFSITSSGTEISTTSNTADEYRNEIFCKKLYTVEGTYKQISAFTEKDIIVFMMPDDDITLNVSKDNGSGSGDGGGSGGSDDKTITADKLAKLENLKSNGTVNIDKNADGKIEISICSSDIQENRDVINSMIDETNSLIDKLGSSDNAVYFIKIKTETIVGGITYPAGIYMQTGSSTFGSGTNIVMIASASVSGRK